jgi:hypothetical protein
MRSLQTVRARVERLASACLPAPEPLVNIFHEQCRYTPCPACGADLQAHAQALAVAVADRVRGVAHVVEYDQLTTCPRCAMPLP